MNMNGDIVKSPMQIPIPIAMPIALFSNLGLMVSLMHRVYDFSENVEFV